jgi:hypothetical protein
VNPREDRVEEVGVPADATNDRNDRENTNVVWWTTTEPKGKRKRDDPLSRVCAAHRTASVPALPVLVYPGVRFLLSLSDLVRQISHMAIMSSAPKKISREPNPGGGSEVLGAGWLAALHGTLLASFVNLSLRHSYQPLR